MGAPVLPPALSIRRACRGTAQPKSPSPGVKVTRAELDGFRAPASGVFRLGGMDQWVEANAEYGSVSRVPRAQASTRNAELLSYSPLTPLPSHPLAHRVIGSR